MELVGGGSVINGAYPVLFKYKPEISSKPDIVIQSTSLKDLNRSVKTRRGSPVGDRLSLWSLQDLVKSTHFHSLTLHGTDCLTTNAVLNPLVFSEGDLSQFIILKQNCLKRTKGDYRAWRKYISLKACAFHVKPHKVQRR